MNLKQTLASVAVVTIILASLGTPRLAAQPFDIAWFTIDGGGGYSTAGNVELDGTIGQHDAGAVMIGGNFSLTGGFWGGSSTGGGGPVCADGGTLIEGTGQQNDFNATCGSDDVRWAAHGATFAFQVADPVVQFELTATAPASFNGSTISVDVEASKQSNTASLILRAQLYDFTNGSYVALPGTLNLTTSDQVKNYALAAGSNPNNFIEPGTDQVRLLLQTIQTSGTPNMRTQLDEVLFHFD